MNTIRAYLSKIRTIFSILKNDRGGFPSPPQLHACEQGFPQVLRTWGALQNLMGGAWVSAWGSMGEA